ncbi:hypothetical protein CMI37_22325 [Candidatus Pacearchaeota archaeon]|nr:hypothetical protein [Candidatus Pacearchaeota archaeon]|tara:strand:- start:4383 stop:4802 length:420 start_codon:yes stop_codon:yes gene_type:complete
MAFKSDKQRKAVMAKLNQGQIRSNVNPTIVNKTFTRTLFPKERFNLLTTKSESAFQLFHDLRFSFFDIVNIRGNTKITIDTFANNVTEQKQKLKKYDNIIKHHLNNPTIKSIKLIKDKDIKTSKFKAKLRKKLVYKITF